MVHILYSFTSSIDKESASIWRRPEFLPFKAVHSVEDSKGVKRNRGYLGTASIKLLAASSRNHLGPFTTVSIVVVVVIVAVFTTISLSSLPIAMFLDALSSSSKVTFTWSPALISCLRYWSPVHLCHLRSCPDIHLRSSPSCFLIQPPGGNIHLASPCATSGTHPVNHRYAASNLLPYQNHHLRC